MASDRLSSFADSPEYRSFRTHYADLLEGIDDPVSLSARLYSAGVLSSETRMKISSGQSENQQKMSELLDAMEKLIQLDPSNYHKFVETLERDTSMQHLCAKLRSTFAQLKSPQTPQLVSSVPLNTSAAQQTSMIPSSITSSSDSSTTANCLKQYKQFLKNCYRQPLPDDDKLLTTASKHYIELAVISKKGVTRKQADEYTRKSLHGLTEEILREKEPIALGHILKPKDGRRVRCLLVDGAPGIGKSTLAWEVCHKWEELESVKQFELVVLVNLREKKAQEARCLEDLLPCDATTNMKELVAAIGQGEGMLIVCDGFDELPCEQRQEGSVYIDLLKGRLLPEATVIVTSCPSISAELWRLCRHNIHRHLEVIGFTKEDIKRFAESVFSGDILAGFLSYITSNPSIHSMMYIPLNAVIVALIYQDSYDTDTPCPTTMTQLYDALARGLIRRHLLSTRRVPSEYCMPPSLQRTEDISKLPSLVAQQFLQLARVAYESLRENRYVLTDLGEDFEHLGTMKKTTSINVCTGPGCSYSFLHLTLHEYLTALHIAIVNPSGLELAEWLQSHVHTNVVRFLVEILQQHDYHSHPLYEICQEIEATTPHISTPTIDKPRLAELTIDDPCTQTGTALYPQVAMTDSESNPISQAKKESGMSTHGETVFEVIGDKPQKLEWIGFGLFIEVPVGALPPGVTASVTVKVIAGDKFEFPANRQLISALYWISSTEKFLKEVSVNIEHCAVIKNEEQCSQFKFIVGKRSQEVLSYSFRERDGVFNPHTQFGTFKLQQSLLIGETAPDNIETHCSALIFYKKQQLSSSLIVDLHFVVVKNLEPFLQYVDSEYQGWIKDNHSLRVLFSNKTYVQLDQKEETMDPWAILPLSSSKINYDDVSYFIPGRSIPHCAFELQLLPGKEFKRLLHRVDIIGAPSLKSFHIRYPQSEDVTAISSMTSDVEVHHRSSPSLSLQQSDRPTYNQLLSLKKADGSTLKVIQWITLSEQWQCTDFAHMLLNDDVLVSRYEKECKEKDEFIRMILKDWLSRDDNDPNDSAVPRTWSALAECITEAGLDVALTEAIRDTFMC